MTLSERIKKNIHGFYLAAIFLLSMGLSCSLIAVHEQFYQTEKDIFSYLAFLFAMLIIGLAGGINLRKWYIWVEMLACVVGTIAYLFIKNIRPSTYGESYFKVVALKVVLWAVFAFLVVNLINKGTLAHIKSCVRVPFFWVTLLVCAVVAVFEHDPIPAVCPIVVFLLSDISEERWTEVCDCFALSYGLGFAAFFTRSLILAPTVDDGSGRYMGVFLNNSKLGALCGVAMVCFGYLFLRLMRQAKRSVIKILPICLLFVYATVAFLMVKGRAGELGLVLAVMTGFMFLHKSTKKHATAKRVMVVLGCACAVLVAGVIMAHVLQQKVVRGEMKYDDMSYSLAHIVAAVEKDRSGGDFEANSLLNALDILSAQRLTTWKQLGVQIIPFGHVEGVDTATHSTYLYWMVKYGLIPGIAVILWFIYYYLQAAVRTVKGSKSAVFPLLWCGFYAGVFLTSNEYWGAPGAFMMLFMAGTLIFSLRERIEHEG